MQMTFLGSLITFLGSASVHHNIGAHIRERRPHGPVFIWDLSMLA